MGNIKLFTHTDLDGAGCAVVGNLFANVLGSQCDIKYHDYDTINESIISFFESRKHEDYSYIFIADISINIEVANMISNEILFSDNKRQLIKLLDHHVNSKTSFLNDYSFAIVREFENEEDGNKCSGASMLFNYIKGNLLDGEKKHNLFDKYRFFINAVRSYDVWEWKETANQVAPNLNSLFYIYGMEKFVSEFSNRFHDFFDIFTKTEMSILSLEETRNQNYIDKKLKEVFDANLIIENNENITTLKFKAVYAESNISILGNKIAELYPESDGAMIIDMSKSVSLRGVSDEIHLGEVAKYFGGGGHKKAAGFPIENLNQLIVNGVSIIYTFSSKCGHLIF